MSRYAVVIPVILVAWVLEPVQTAGTILTSSDISSEHLFRPPVEVEGRSWLGLYRANGSWRLSSASVRWVAGEMFGDSTFSIAVDPPDPVLLVADVPAIAGGAAVTVTQGSTLHRGAETVELELAQRTYRLELVAADPMLCDARVVLSEGQVSQDLYFPDFEYLSCDEPHFTVDWAGDLDGDERLDLVVTFSQKYSVFPRRLYLSSAAQGGMPVGLAAAFDP